MKKAGDHLTGFKPRLDDVIVYSQQSQLRHFGKGAVPHGPTLRPATPRTFHDDALLLLDALTVSHGLPVVSTRTHTTVVEHQIERLMGLGRRKSRLIRSMLGENTTRIDSPTTPTVLTEKLTECAQLFMMFSYGWPYPCSHCLSRGQARMEPLTQ